MQNGIEKKEKSMLLLVERRGVAGQPWKNEIDKILSYIRKFINNNAEKCDRHEEIVFTIDSEN